MVARIFLGLSIMAIFGFFNNSQAANPKDNEPKTEADNSTTGAGRKAIPTLKQAYVNMEKIITLDERLLPNASNEWKEFYAELKKTVEPAQREFTDLRDKYEKGKKEFQSLQSSSLTSQEALKRKYEEIARIEYELSTRMQELNAFTQNEIQKAQERIGPKLQRIIEDIRVAQGWDYVVKNDFVLAADKRFDLTDEVLAKLNKDFADEKAKKAAASKKDTESARKPKTI